MVNKKIINFRFSQFLKKHGNTIEVLVVEPQRGSSACGEVWDEEGTYPTGSIVWRNRETTHTPKTRGKTLILVLWPEGVKSA